VGDVETLGVVLAPMMEALRAMTVDVGGDDGEDAEACCEALAAPLVAYAEACAERICAGSCSRVEAVLQAMLECLAHPVLGVSMQAQTFWSALRKVETQLPGGYLPLLDEAFARAEQQMVARSTYPEEEQWLRMDDDERQDTHMYRRAVRDSLRELVVGRAASEVRFLAWGQQAIAEEITRRGWTSGSALTGWQPCEAIVHAMTAVSKFVGKNETEHMTPLMGHLTRLPSGHAGIGLSVVCCIAANAEWLLNGREALLTAAFEFTIASLSLPECPQEGFPMLLPGSTDHQGAVCLFRLCSLGGAQLAQLGAGPRLVNIYTALEANRGLMFGQSSRAVGVVLRSVCEVVSAMPPQAAAAPLESLCAPLTRRLCSMGAETTPEEAVEVLQRFEAVLGHMRANKGVDSSQHPAVVILRHVWDSVVPLLVCENPEVQHAACRVLTSAVRNGGAGLGTLYLQIVQLAARAIEATKVLAQQAPLLDLLAVCGKVLYTRPARCCFQC